MLIVIVIIWILAAAIVPKITGVLARARDTQRVADLRNIALAIESYRADYWEFPKRNETYPKHWDAWYHAGSVWWLSDTLWDYITDLPKDPKKSASIKGMYYHCMKENWKYWDNCGHYTTPFFKDWEYFYQELRLDQKALLIAKAETPSIANFVADDKNKGSALSLGCSEDLYKINVLPPYKHPACDKFLDNYLILCDSIKKWEAIQQATGEDRWCTYTDESQLFYIMKIQ